MATLVLGTVGGVLGGPIGATIGATIGNLIDHDLLFRPKGREGPRLADLAVQTSTYGAALPRLFGTLRVAGSVIWSTDLIEHRATEGHGKGQPRTTSYSYTASFAVALSARPILEVRRIWADGNLLRGAAGDFKTRLGGFRVHAGGEDQAPDPAIAAAEGALAPAHRGLAYAVFEELELGDFGNRIPSLTFEVVADAEPPGIGAIVEALSAGLVRGEDGLASLDGYSAYGATIRDAIAPLTQAAGGWCRTDAGLTLLSGEGSAVDVPDAGARAEGARGGRRIRTIAAADAAPKAVSISYYDASRDYQTGVQRAARPGAGTRETQVGLPAVLSAGAAKTLAEAALARGDAERERRSVTLDWRAMAQAPGERITIGGEPGQWRIDRWSLEAMALTLECVRIGAAPLPASASAGRAAAAADAVAGTTLLVARELPALDGSLWSAPRLTLIANGSAPGWRSAALTLSTDGGASWAAIGTTAAPGVIGAIAVPPGTAPATLEDRANMLEVTLARADMALHDADQAQLEAGANLAIAGDELLQFGRAEPLGGARWRLSRLWRGRRGTEWAIGVQVEGDGFACVAGGAVALAELPTGAIGATALLLASGTGDATPAAASATIGGASVVPPSPVHLAARRDSDGSTRLSWARRSRAGWRWIDGVDAPLAEEREAYRVTITPESGAPWTIEASVTHTTLSDSERTQPLHVAVRQIGSNGVSLAAELLLPTLGD